MPDKRGYERIHDTARGSTVELPTLFRNTSALPLHQTVHVGYDGKSSSGSSEKARVGANVAAKRRLLFTAAALIACTGFVVHATSPSSSIQDNLVQESSSPATFYTPPRHYHTKIELDMPYLGLKEPFEVWADEDQNLQRISYWGELNQFFLNGTGTGCQVMPMSTDGSTSQQVVFQIAPAGTPASLFPDIEAKGAAFTQKIDPETGAPAVAFVRGVECDVFELVEPHYDPHADGFTGYYTYYLARGEGTPMRLNFLGHNVITNSHFDNYTFDYLTFSNAPVLREDLVYPGGCAFATNSITNDDDNSGPTSSSSSSSFAGPTGAAGAIGSTGSDAAAAQAAAQAAATEDREGVLGALLHGLMPGTSGDEVRRNQWNNYALNYGKPTLASLPAESSSGSTSSGSSSSSSSGSENNGDSSSEDGSVSWADRRALFRHTMRQITAMNARNTQIARASTQDGGSSTSLSTSANYYRVGLNHMADWTSAEKAKLRGRLHSITSENTRTTADRTAKLGGLLRDFDVQAAVEAASNVAASASALRGEDGEAARQQQAAEHANLLDNHDNENKDKTDHDASATASASSSGTSESTSSSSSSSSSAMSTTATSSSSTDALSSINGVAIEGHVLPSLPGHDASLSEAQQLDLLDALLPEAVDWRGAYGQDPSSSAPKAVVGPVKDQGTCGSCWTFGTAGATEMHAAIAQLGLNLKGPHQAAAAGKADATTGEKAEAAAPTSGDDYTANAMTPSTTASSVAAVQKLEPMLTLSEQAIVDCAWPYGNQGCDGGEDDLGYLWIIDHGGLPQSKNYGPYVNADGACHSGEYSAMEGAISIDGFMQVPTNDQRLLKAALALRGPVSVSIDATPASFYYYSGGLYSAPADECSTDLAKSDHIVMLVGYGVDDTVAKTPYWILRNSWSSHWGESGYMRIAATGNTCGVSNKATFPALSQQGASPAAAAAAAGVAETKSR